MVAERTTRRATVLATVAACCAIALLAAGAAEASAFQLPGLNGGELTAEQIASGTTVMVVWASWSPRCRDIGAETNALLDRWGDKARLVTVNFQEEREVAQTFASQQGMRAPVFLDLDGEFAKGFGVTALPGLLVLRDGKVAFSGRLTSEAGRIISEQIP